ncbi:zf-DNL-domain-containing protein [Backusella circina FSU 941]|nr:zf-DNL-domain-containing protein [Backusella circina FSU 941]
MSMSYFTLYWSEMHIRAYNYDTFGLIILFMIILESDLTKPLMHRFICSENELRLTCIYMMIRVGRFATARRLLGPSLVIMTPKFSRPFVKTALMTPRHFVCNNTKICSFHSKPSLFEQQRNEPVEEDPNHKMLIGFTCQVCQERSHHVMSKRAYTKGVVLIQCPGCKNRHLIADNLGWFQDSKTTVEDLVKEKGEAIRKIVVDEDGVEKLGDLMEWLPEITKEEKLKKDEAKKKAEQLQQEEKQM